MLRLVFPNNASNSPWGCVLVLIMSTIVPISDTVCKLFLPLSDKDVRGWVKFSVVGPQDLNHIGQVIE